MSFAARPGAVRRERGVVIGNVEDKYASRNPISRRLVGGFLRRFRELVGRTGASSAFEVGCGEGRLTLELARLGLAVRATDFSAEILEEARRRVRESERPELVSAFAVADVYDLSAFAGAELVVCCEVFEHLREPDRALDGLARLAKPWLLASVPREPLWRALNVARGRYLGRLGNTPGHLQHWSKRGFLRFLSRRFEIVEVRSPLPWTMALAKRRGRCP